MKPVLKWVGGKTQLLPTLMQHVPDHFKTYYEPYIGGGALFFHLQPERGEISDINYDLINFYEVLKSEPLDLFHNIRALAGYHSRHGEATFRIAKNYINMPVSETSPFMRAAAFWYINKAGFNGLWRVNQKGKCNVSWGKREFIIVPDEGLVKEYSEFLGKHHIFHRPAFDINPCLGDFVYLDPPYVPVKPNSFVGYTTLDLIDEACDLKDKLEKWHYSGVKILMSSSDSTMIKSLYSDRNIWEVISVQARRNVNSNGKGRGPVGEFLIKNY
jgi:DNA adenine methylase